MKGFCLIALCVLSIQFLCAQNDLIEFREGGSKEVVFVLESIPGIDDTIFYNEPNMDVVQYTEMREVKRLTLSDGYILYENLTPLPKEEEVETEALPLEITSDQIVPFNKAPIRCVLILEKIPEREDILSYKMPGKEAPLSISMELVQQLILSDGTLIYQNDIPPATPIAVVPVIVEPESNVTDTLAVLDTTAFVQNVVEPRVVVPDKCNSPELQALKLKVEYETVKKYDQLVEEVSNVRSKSSNANYANQEAVKKDVYRGIKDDINQLKCGTSKVDAIVTIKVDTAGEVISINDEVFSSDQLRNYYSIRDKSLTPFLNAQSFPTNDTLFDYSSKLDEQFNGYQNEIDLLDCDQAADGIMDLAELRFKKIDKQIVTQNTTYQIPIKFSFNSKKQTWLYYNNSLYMKEGGKKIRIKNNSVKLEFASAFEKEPQSAKYTVNACYYKVLSDSLKMEVISVKKKYKFYTHIGINSSVYFHLSSSRVQFKTGQLIGVSGMIIFHRIGFFGGTIINNNGMYPVSERNGLFLEKKPFYLDAGIYIGLAQYLFIKGGYAQIKSAPERYVSGSLDETLKESVQHGFTGGIALVFPVLSLEGGYNTTLKAPYANLGLNIPLNQ